MSKDLFINRKYYHENIVANHVYYKLSNSTKYILIIISNDNNNLDVLRFNPN